MMKIYFKGYRFNTIVKIQNESEEVIDSRKMTSRPDSKMSRNAEIGELLRKGDKLLILRI